MMDEKSLTQKQFNDVFEGLKEDILSTKVDKLKDARTLKFVSDALKSYGHEFVYLLFKKLIKIDKKIDVNIEVAEMYSFAAMFCIAKRLSLSDKEINQLYDDIDRETKGILEGTMKAKQEMKYLKKIFALRYKPGSTQA